MIYLSQYRTHQSVEELNTSVNNHISKHRFDLNETDKAVLTALSQHSLQFTGACHVKHETIANKVGKSIRTVQRSIKKLTELHVIETHSNTRKNGQKGANIYSILKFNDNDVVSGVTSKVSEHISFNSFNLSSNPSVLKNVVNNVNACAGTDDLKMQLRAIYQPQSVEGNQAFEELCKIAFGRIKQFMRSHNVPYLQLEQIVVKAMNDLVRKQNVKNQFAMYSAMIKRQVEQLFEEPVKPVQAFKQPSKELIPEWFNKRNEPSTGETASFDFESERQKILAKLG